VVVVVAFHSCDLDALGKAYLGVVRRRAVEAPCCPSAVAVDHADHGDLTAAWAGASSAQTASEVVGFLHAGCCPA